MTAIEYFELAGIKCAVQLEDGGVISINEIQQMHSYRGNYITRPSEEINQRMLEEAVADAEQSFRLPVVLLPVTPIERKDGRRFLPPICCAARFTLFQADRETLQLGAVWCQDQFGLPNDMKLFEALGELFRTKGVERELL